MDKWTIVMIIIVLIFFGTVAFVDWKNYRQEGYKYSILKNSLGPAYGTNILINLDQAFAFFAGLVSASPLPLNTSEAFTGLYNDKDKLMLLANHIYAYHTSYIDKKTFDEAVKKLGPQFSNWEQSLQSAKVECEVSKTKRQIPQLFNFDQLLGFIAGTIISESKDMMFPCYNLIQYVQDFLYHNDLDAVSSFINYDLKVKGGECTKEVAEMSLKSLGVDTKKLQDSLKSYCEQYCDKKIC